MMNLVPDESDDDVLAEISPELLAQLDGPPEQWLAQLTSDALPAVNVPREAMWTAIQQQRRFTQSPQRRSWMRMPAVRTMIGIAATLVVGVAIGRYLMPSGGVVRGPASSVAQNGATPGVAANSPTAPLAIAVTEHLVRTEALLTTVRLDSSSARSAAEVSNWARDLLGTTRLLLEDPSLRDAKTRNLLEDLELVLVQVVQAGRSSAPLVRRAPSETLRETNLLPRVRAASSGTTAMIPTPFPGGVTE